MNFECVGKLILAGLSPLAGANIVAAGEAASSQSAATTQGIPADPEIPTILVIGQRRGSVVGNFATEIEFSESDIKTFLARNIAQIVETLDMQLGGNGAANAGPVVLLNGRRVTDFTEYSRLPSELVERVEVLGPDVAAHFGYQPNRKVINIVLKPNFRATTVTVAQAQATSGGWRRSEGAASFVRIAGPARLSIDAAIAGNSHLTEAKRGIGIPPGALDRLATPADRELIAREPEFRTLVPRSSGAEAGASYTRPLSGPTTMTLSGRFSTETKTSRLGLASVDLVVPPDNPYATSPDARFPIRRLIGEYSPLERTSRIRTATASLALDGELARLTWSISAKWSCFQAETVTGGDPDPAPVQQAIDAGETGLDPFGPLPLRLLRLDRSQTARFRSDRTDLAASAQGPVIDLPAGALTANFNVSAAANRIASVVEVGGSESSARLSRNSFVASAGFNLPLASHKAGVIGALGDLSANARLEVQNHSDFGWLTALSYGLTWQPHKRTTVRLSFIDDRSAPSMPLLGNPQTLTPGRRIHDFLSSNDVEILLIEDGNRDLRAEHRRSFEAAFNHRLLTGKRNISISLEYRDVSVRDRIGSVSGAAANFQTTFPERYLRNADGRLVGIDARPFNFAREEIRQLRWGVQLSLPLGKPRSSGTPVQLTSPVGATSRMIGSLSHSWQLRNRVTLREGAPQLDLNGKDVFGYPGNWPRHDVQFQLGFFSGGIGATATAHWRSESRLIDRADVPLAGSRTLSFSDVLLAGLVVNFELGELKAFREGRNWFKGAALSLSVKNILNERLAVRDGNGRTLFSYQPAYFDPAGRTFAIGLRKQF